MPSIRKTVLTPVKWASKKLLEATLLKFPGDDPHDPVACTYCPEMCRFSCPTAVASANDAVTPCNKMSLLHKESRWPGVAQGTESGGELWPIYDCTGCGRCTDYCVYEVPVARTLTHARAEHKWYRAEAVFKSIAPDSDPWGDLAAELGFRETALERLERRIEASRDGIAKIHEPKSLYYARAMGKSNSTLTWESEFTTGPGKEVLTRLQGKRWLLHESVWLSRRLGRWLEVEAWVRRAQSAGIQIELPYEHYRDCIDCGGEGAYPRLFPSQASEMARVIWERDQSRVDGILCMSQRCANHLKSVLAREIPEVAIETAFP